MDTSPSKRRVLGPIDVNSRSPVSASKHQELKSKALSPITSIIDDSTKRPLEPEVVDQRQEHALTPPAKKPRLSVSEEEIKNIPIDEERRSERDLPREEVERRQSEPREEESSLLDNSVIDTTQDTVVTEPETEVVETAPPIPPAPSRRRSTMTREEARQKAETLRLRLGLASYKVRTGQTDVSLEQLEAKSLLRSRQQNEPSSPSLLRTTSTGEEDGANKVPSSGRKALPTAPSLSRESSFEKGRSGTETKQVPEIAISSWPDSQRASQ
ncbi:hypothetical protein Daesc_008059 [Daldinia eschscholtzii]|uniref:Uncharacterized protein n=1 Tax=Daldinia eschscholtzii TaxID=292717 RepID=A0AAX6MAN2_9PEZI